jgi:RNA polymerase sigma-70 factor (ECF subfamily)
MTTNGRSQWDQAEDRELMMAVQKRDASALEALYDRFVPQVLAVCLRILSDRAEAEEVTVDVFHEIWRRADRFDVERAAPRTYLLLVARSRAIDRHRALQRLGRVCQLSTTPEELDGLYDARAKSLGASRFSSELEAHEVRSRVRVAVEALGAEQRRVVELAFFDGLTHSEISHHLDKPLGTIKTQIRRGLQQLRDALDRQGFDEEVS